jgi:aldehyde dehydrogenase (NAD+)
LLTGGVRKGEKGCFVEPTIFLNPAKDNSCYKDEIFGPVLVVNTFKTEEEVIALANNTTYGLVGTFQNLSTQRHTQLVCFTIYLRFANLDSSACVYTQNLDRALRLSSAIEAGGVSINGPFVPSYQTPFGGFKQSGLGKELGKEGLMEYTKAKTIHIKYVPVAKLEQKILTQPNSIKPAKVGN